MMNGEEHALWMSITVSLLGDNVGSETNVKLTEKILVNNVSNENIHKILRN